MLGIIDAMTPEERRRPERVVDGQRRRRIAKGAGVSPDEVETLVAQFEPMAKLMNKISGGRA